LRLKLFFFSEFPLNLYSQQHSELPQNSTIDSWTFPGLLLFRRVLFHNFRKVYEEIFLLSASG